VVIPAAPLLTPEAWHAWFLTQAGWTRQTRRWLYQQAGLEQASAVLEVGCGSGVIVGELAESSTARVVGLDVDARFLDLAQQHTRRMALVRGDALDLPFADATFDIVVCHYLLLWLSDAARGVQEMARVARRSGCVLACADPDYGGRLDHPPELAKLGQLQAKALRQQGADPEIGRRLGALFTAAGLATTVGTMAGQWTVPATPDASFEAEWTMRAHDLAGMLSPEELQRLYELDQQALLNGQRTLFVPTLYALGRPTG